MTQLDAYKKKQKDLVSHTQDKHATCIEELQKKIVVLEEDVWDRHKRLDIELNEKSKTAIQESVKSVIAETDTVKEELREHVEQVTKLNAMIDKLQKA
ncbi:hypothetical protein H0H87_001135 [Tephrocybe sp. NHM501043]|nr:hypothetical protein H0H87_001135 [Tephrocybe sp. NHM501043]